MTDSQNRTAEEIHVEESEKDARIRDIIQNIDSLLETFKQEHDVEHFRDVSQQEWTGALKYVQFTYIRPTKCLYKYTPDSIHNGYQTLMYDDYIVSHICDYYMYLCNMYSKIVNIYGFYALTGADFDTIASWGMMESQRPQAFRTWKRLRNEYESSLENGAQSGKNPVGFIATLNHRFSWSSDSRPALQVNITRSREQILSSVNQDLLEEVP